MQIFSFRYLATGASFRSLAFQFRMGRSTISKIVTETCEAIWKNVQPIYMPFPDRKLCMETAKQFNLKWNFPNCFGAVDGKHIRIEAPHKSGSLYYNYKQFFSLVLQGVADHECKFVTVDIGAYGRQSDGGVFRNSDLAKCLDNNAFDCPASQQLPGSEDKTPFVIVGDEAYPLLPFLMRPYPRQNLDQSKKIFNYRLSRARRCVECAFGIMTAKFRLLTKSIETSVEHATVIVKAICVLHNMILAREGIDTEAATGVEDHCEIVNTRTPTAERNSPRYAINVRNTLTTYFTSPVGSVPWQAYI